jgi:glycosyltransferase involved in cell wall biosynthesis
MLHSNSLAGAERLHLDLLDDLDRKDFDTLTILPNYDGLLDSKLLEKNRQFIKIDGLEWWTNKTFSNINEFSERQRVPLRDAEFQINKFDPDFIVTHTGVIPHGALIAKKLRIAHIWFLHEFLDIDHGLHIPLGRENFAKFVEDSSLHVIANSKSTLAHFFPDRRTILNNVCYMYPRITNENLTQKKTNKMFTIGIVASFQVGKGHEILFKAIQRLDLEQKFKLRVIGDGSEDDRKRLNDIVKKLDIENIVEFAGAMESITDIYADLDLVVVPSLFESFGRVGIEAIKLRIPVIYSNSGGMPEYMQDGVSGLSFIPGDDLDLRDKILQVVNNPKLQSMLTETAFKFIEENENSLQNSLFFRKLLINHYQSSKSPLKKFVFWLRIWISSNRGCF